jgi:hypothetical protein
MVSGQAIDGMCADLDLDFELDPIFHASVHQFTFTHSPAGDTIFPNLTDRRWFTIAK